MGSFKPPGKKQPDPVDVFVGERIRAHRNAKGVSQTALGNHLHVTFQQVQKYEKGRNRVSAGKLKRIAELFGVRVADFYPGTEPSGDGTSSAALALGDPAHKMSLTRHGMRLAIAWVRLRTHHQEVVLAVAEALLDANP